MSLDSPPPVCILAGGLGTRLGAIARAVPKGLVSVAGEPFLVHQLRQLRRDGLERVVLCVGHLGEQIERTLGRSCEGLAVEYSYDGPGLDGTLGAVRRAAPLLGPDFLIMYGDTFLQVDVRHFHTLWKSSNLPGGMTVYRNEGRFDRSNVVYRDGGIELYDKTTSDPEMMWIDYGLGALEIDALGAVPSDARDLADLYGRLSRMDALYGYEVKSRFYEIGSPAALAETAEFLRSRRARDD